MEEMIGKGGHGIIYLMSNGAVRKVSCTSYNCKQSEKEYINQHSAATVYNRDYDNTYAKILSPRNWVYDYGVNEKGDKCCSYEMDRILPPEGKLLWQTYLYAYNKDMDKTISSEEGFIRGRYVGPNTLEKFLRDESSILTLQMLSNLAGKLIGVVHFGAEQTGNDTELVLGRIDDDFSLYLIDFDRSTSWNDPNPETGLPFTERQIIVALFGTLEAEEFYPGHDDPDLCEHFEEGYLDAASRYRRVEMAKKVLNMRLAW